MVEDFHLSQNASAVLRTSEGLGIQDIHIVENENSFKLNRDVTRGSNKWLTLPPVQRSRPQQHRRLF